MTKRMTQREAWLKFVGHDDVKPVMSYGKRMALLAKEPVSAAAVDVCVVPTAKGDECQNPPIVGEQYCGAHKQRVAKAVVAVLSR